LILMVYARRKRTYLDVSYELRAQVKLHGARWDNIRKSWYVLGEVPEMLADLVIADRPPTEGGASFEASIKRQSAPKVSFRSPPDADAQADFFVPALHDVAGKESRSTMDVAVFRLSKKNSRAGETIRYELSDGYVEVKSGADGMASVWDYDIVLMAISQLTEAMNRYRAGQGEKPGRRFRPHISEILKFCRKGGGGRQASEIEAALDRLRSTTIKIVRFGGNSEGRQIREVEAEGLINNYRAVSHTDTNKLAVVEIELPNWIYRQVVESQRPDVLTVHRDYFLLEQGIARFIYRLARRAAGKEMARWSFRTIFERSGSSGTFKEFCRLLRGIIQANDLPEYNISEEKGNDDPILLMSYRDTATAIALSETEGG
jgi:plasmid replication initiation protein